MKRDLVIALLPAALGLAIAYAIARHARPHR